MSALRTVLAVNADGIRLEALGHAESASLALDEVLLEDLGERDEDAIARCRSEIIKVRINLKSLADDLRRLDAAARDDVKGVQS